jgi:hypothetical protein
MKLIVTLVATMSMSWMGCTADMADPAGGGDDGTGTGTGGNSSIDPGPGTGPVTEASGHITSNTTWSDRIHVASTITVDPNVTLTIAAGTTVNLETNGGIAVSGTLALQGTSTSKVVLRAATAGGYWSTISVPSHGTVTASYLVQVGGVLAITGGSVTLVDSHMALARGDLLTMDGGTLDMSYSQIGLELGQQDTSHCDLHVSNAPTVKITRSNMSTSSYGIMFYGGTNATFTYTNWFGNGVDVDAKPQVSGDFSHSYFAKGAPTGGGITATDVQTTRVTNAGVGAPR